MRGLKRAPKGPSSISCAPKAQKVEKPKCGAWTVGTQVTRGSGEDLGEGWHGGGANLGLDSAEVKEGWESQWGFSRPVN